MPHPIERITHPEIRPAFARYPLAVKAAGLVFLSGVRAGMRGADPRRFDELPQSARARQQGYTLVDDREGVVSAESWNAHDNLEAVLKAAGTSGDQLLRQHIWQRDKRFFPAYERVRMHWQEAPAPSSGLGVARISGRTDGWIGMDGIAVCPGANALFPAREVVRAVYDKRLPSASHYSQAVRSGPLLCTAGHIAIKTAEPGKPLVNGFDDIPAEGRFLATGRSHPDSRDGPLAAQSWYVYHELKRTLEQHAMTMNDVIHSSVFLSDVRDFAVFHRVHAHFFPSGGPTLCVTGFDEVGHRGCRIEIELTAAANGAVTRSAHEWPCPAPFAAPAVVRAGPLLYCSGVVGIGGDGMLARNADTLPAAGQALVRELEAQESRRGLAAQCWAAFDTLQRALSGAGSGLDRLVKTTVYLRNENDRAIYETVRAAFIDTNALPALEVVLVHSPGPVPDAHVQIEAIAVE